MSLRLYEPLLRASAAGGDARRLVRLLRVDRRPWRVQQATGGVALVHRERRLERLRPLDARPRVAVAREPRGDGGERELVRVDVVEPLPGQRRGDLTADPRAHRPGAE